MNGILFLTNLLPFPGISGGTQVSRKKIDNFIEMGYKIHLFFMNTAETDEKSLQDFLKLYQEKTDIHYCPNLNNKRSMEIMLKSFCTMVPLNIYRNRCDQLKTEIHSFLQYL